MKSGEVYGDVEEVNALIRKHETFEKLLSPLEEKVTGLKQTARSLVERKHMQSPDVQLTADDVEKRYRNLLKTVADRKRLLQQSLALAKFNSNVSEVSSSRLVACGLDVFVNWIFRLSGGLTKNERSCRPTKLTKLICIVSKTN